MLLTGQLLSSGRRPATRTSLVQLLRYLRPDEIPASRLLPAEFDRARATVIRPYPSYAGQVLSTLYARRQFLRLQRAA
jgi:hypothetical protein